MWSPVWFSRSDLRRRRRSAMEAQEEEHALQHVDEPEAEGYIYDSEDDRQRCSDGSFSGQEDEDVEGVDDGADTPSKFAHTRSSTKHLTEVEWATVGAAEAGLGAEVLNINEHSAALSSSSVSWWGDMHSSCSREQIDSVAAALFSDSVPPARHPSTKGSTGPGAGDRAGMPAPPSHGRGDQSLQAKPAPSTSCPVSSWVSLDDLKKMAKR